MDHSTVQGLVKQAALMPPITCSIKQRWNLLRSKNPVFQVISSENEHLKGKKQVLFNVNGMPCDNCIHIHSHTFIPLP